MQKFHHFADSMFDKESVSQEFVSISLVEMRKHLFKDLLLKRSVLSRNNALKKDRDVSLLCTDGAK